jgi:hypothetical protein
MHRIARRQRGASNGRRPLGEDWQFNDGLITRAPAGRRVAPYRLRSWQFSIPGTDKLFAKLDVGARDTLTMCVTIGPIYSSPPCPRSAISRKARINLHAAIGMGTATWRSGSAHRARRRIADPGIVDAAELQRPARRVGSSEACDLLPVRARPVASGVMQAAAQE